MVIGFVPLPERFTPVPGAFTNMNGYWNPPACVKSFTATSATIEVFGYDEFYECIEEVKASYNACIDQFYRENAL